MSHRVSHSPGPHILRLGVCREGHILLYRVSNRHGETLRNDSTPQTLAYRAKKNLSPVPYTCLNIYSS